MAAFVLNNDKGENVHCINCGIELDDIAKFCSACGKDISSVPPLPGKSHDWDLHVNVLAWVIIAQAALTAIIGLIIMFGGQVVRNLMIQRPNLFPPDLPPDVVHIIGPASFLIGVIFLLIATPSIASGIGLLNYRNWGRVLTLIMSFLRILEVPLGTATAIYAFWVLLSRGGREFFRRKTLAT
jgi:hypothetical protein